MAFKDEKRSSGIINMADIMRKISDEQFVEFVKVVKGWTLDERVIAGRNTFALLLQHFGELKDETSIRTMLLFLHISTKLGCMGLDAVSDKKKKEVLDYFQDLTPFQNAVRKEESFFDYKLINDSLYCQLVDNYFCATLEPLIPPGSDYILHLFTYMLLVACADTVNDKGIKTIQKLREDYLDYAPLKRDGKVSEFKGTLDKTILLSPEQKREVEEAQRKAKKDAEIKDQEDRHKQLYRIKNLNKGDTFLFGSYPQISKRSNDRVEWVVLDKTSNSVMVISKKILDVKPFHRSKVTTPWSKSLIRTWLNNEFIEKAFNDEEKSLIVPTAIKEPGSDGTVYNTTDKVFLLSEQEVKRYFTTVESRSAESTKVAGNEYWGLRSYKKGADSFQYCTSGGRVMSNKFGTDGFTYINYDCALGVRPAMWLSIEYLSPDERLILQEEKELKEKEKIKEKERKKREREVFEVKKKAYEDARNVWIDECSIIREKRAKEIENREEEYRSNFIKEQTSKCQTEMSTKNHRIVELNAQIEEEKAIIAGLGFLKILEKKRHQDKIVALSKEILCINSEIEQIKEIYATDSATVERELAKVRKMITTCVEKAFPLPPEPPKPILPKANTKAEKTSKNGKSTRLLKDLLPDERTILKKLGEVPQTTQEIQNSILPRCSTMRVEILLNRLACDGYLTIVKDGNSTYYCKVKS